jgi:hypothetical protein
MSRIRTALTSVGAAVATIALGVGIVNAVFPAADTDLKVPNVVSNIQPAPAQPGPVVPQPASKVSVGEAWASGGSPAAAAPRPVDKGSVKASGRDAYNTPCDTAPDPNNCTDPVCVSAGNPTGVCWYDGFQFTNRTVCIEASANASWTQATAETTLNWVAYQWAVNGLRIYVRTTQWGCSAAGFAATQIVYYEPYNAADGNCGLSYAMGAGYTSNVVAINMRADYAASCRTGGYWNRTWGHEFGHQIGLSHTAEAVSIMRYSLSRSSIDAWKVANLYTGNPCGDPLYPACV